jgi:hypothetical protein
MVECVAMEVLRLYRLSFLRADPYLVYESSLLALHI